VGATSGREPAEEALAVDAFSAAQLREPHLDLSLQLIDVHPGIVAGPAPRVN
jgi:hypothetical protein